MKLSQGYQFEADYGSFSRYRRRSDDAKVVIVQYLLPDAIAQRDDRDALLGFIDLIKTVPYLTIPTPLESIESENYYYLVYQDASYKSMADTFSAYNQSNPIPEELFWELSGELLSTILHLRTCLANYGFSLWLEDLTPLNVLLNQDNHIILLNLVSLKVAADDVSDIFLRYQSANADTIQPLQLSQAALEYCRIATSNNPHCSLHGADLNAHISRSLGSLLYYFTTGSELETALTDDRTIEYIIMDIEGTSAERKALLLGLLSEPCDADNQGYSMDLYDAYCICCQQVEKYITAHNTTAPLMEAQPPLPVPESRINAEEELIKSLQIKNTYLEECTARIQEELESKTREVAQLRIQLTEALKKGDEFAKQLPLFQEEISSLRKKLMEKVTDTPSPQRDDLESQVAMLREELSKVYADLQAEKAGKESNTQKFSKSPSHNTDSTVSEVELLKEKIALLQEKLQDRDDLITDLYTSLHSSESIKLPNKATDFMPVGIRPALTTMQLRTSDLSRENVGFEAQTNSTHIKSSIEDPVENENLDDSHGTRRELTEISNMMAAQMSPEQASISSSVDAQLSTIITSSIQHMPVSTRSEKRVEKLNLHDLELNRPSRGIVSVPNRAHSAKSVDNKELDVRNAKRRANIRGGMATLPQLNPYATYSKSAKKSRTKTPSPKIDAHQLLKIQSPSREPDPMDKLIEYKLPNQLIRLRCDLTPADRLLQKFDYNSEYIIKSGEKNYTPLMEVICNTRQPRAAGSKSVINFKNYASYIGCQNDQGLTALMIASMKSNEHAVRFLVKHEANLLTTEGYSALYLALLSSHINIARLLLPYEGFAYDEEHNSVREDGMTSLMLAAVANDIVKAFIYMESQSQSGKQNALGYTALMLAAERDHAEICQLLVSEEKCLRNADSETALMLAARKGCRNSVRVLATSEKGLQNKRGQTALMLASIAGHYNIVNILVNLEAGKNALVFDKETGYTALIYAIKHRRKECIEKLAQREGKKPDMRGNFPRFFASTNDILRLCQLLGIQ